MAGTGLMGVAPIADGEVGRVVVVDLLTRREGEERTRMVMPSEGVRVDGVAEVVDVVDGVAAAVVAAAVDSCNFAERISYSESR
jgi:hypothetical protein